MTTITVSGPLFTGSHHEIEDAVRDTIRELIERGEQKVKAQLYPGHGLISGHYRRSVVGEMADSRHGRLHDSNVIYGPWLEGVGSRNETTRFKGYAMFRNAPEQLQREARGILQKHMRRAAQRLGGA